MVSVVDKQQLRELLEKATPGPWCWESVAEQSNEFVVGLACDSKGKPFDGCINGKDYNEESQAWIEDSIIRKSEVGSNESGSANFADAELICYLRNHASELLEAAERADKCWHGCTNCEGSGTEYDSPSKTRPCHQCNGGRSVYAQIAYLQGHSIVPKLATRAEAAEAQRDRLEKALVRTLIPLEALKIVEHSHPVLSPMLRADIDTAIEIGRKEIAAEALKEAGNGE